VVRRNTSHAAIDHVVGAHDRGRALRAGEELKQSAVPVVVGEPSHGARYIQIEDLGAWMLALDDKSDWVIDVLNAWIDGVDAKIAWH
jgi:hypothetical protein